MLINLYLVQNLTLTGLNIQGELIFDLRDINLRTGWISVTGTGATLSIGSSGCRFANKAIITLTGTRQADAANQPGYKYINIDVGGKIFLFGHHDANAWTRLSQTAIK